MQDQDLYAFEDLYDDAKIQALTDGWNEQGVCTCEPAELECALERAFENLVSEADDRVMIDSIYLDVNSYHLATSLYFHEKSLWGNVLSPSTYATEFCYLKLMPASDFEPPWTDEDLDPSIEALHNGVPVADVEWPPDLDYDMIAALDESLDQYSSDSDVREAVLSAYLDLPYLEKELSYYTDLDFPLFNFYDEFYLQCSSRSALFTFEGELAFIDGEKRLY